MEEEHQTWYFFTVTFHVAATVWRLTQLTARTSAENYSEPSTSVHHANDRLQKTQEKNAYARQAKGIHDVNASMEAESCEMQYGELDSDTDDSHGSRSDGVLRFLVCQFFILVLCRVARTWNRTGDKWAHLPDVGDWLVRWEIFCLAFANVC